MKILPALMLSALPYLAASQPFGKSYIRNGDTVQFFPQNGCDTQIFVQVEQLPEPPVNVNKFLADNLNYPTDAKAEGIEGRVNMVL